MLQFITEFFNTANQYSTEIAKGVALFFGFALFHTVCAQNGFKEQLKKLLGTFFVEHFWRIIYVLISIHLYFNIAAPYLYETIPTIYLFTLNEEAKFIWSWVTKFGLIIFYFALVQIDFLHYFGIKQASSGFIKIATGRLHEKKCRQGDTGLKTKYMYSLARHPMYIGVLIMVGSFAYTLQGAIGLTLIFAYLVVGLPIEERKLISIYGKEYKEYQKQTPSLFPGIGHAALKLRKGLDNA